jgi:hypothetical protein
LWKSGCIGLTLLALRPLHDSGRGSTQDLFSQPPRRSRWPSETAPYNSTWVAAAMSTFLLGIGSSWLKNLLPACLILCIAQCVMEMVCTPCEFLAVLGKIVCKLFFFKRDMLLGSPQAMETTIWVTTAPAVAGRATTTAPSPQTKTAKEAAATHCLLERLESGCTATLPNQAPSIEHNNPF